MSKKKLKQMTRFELKQELKDYIEYLVVATNIDSDYNPNDEKWENLLEKETEYLMSIVFKYN